MTHVGVGVSRCDTVSGRPPMAPLNAPWSCCIKCRAFGPCFLNSSFLNKKLLPLGMPAGALCAGAWANLVDCALLPCRHRFDNALKALPVTQHDRVWPLYLDFVKLSGVVCSDGLSIQIVSSVTLVSPPGRNGRTSVSAIPKIRCISRRSVCQGNRLVFWGPDFASLYL